MIQQYLIVRNVATISKHYILEKLLFGKLLVNYKQKICQTRYTRYASYFSRNTMQ